MTKDNNWPGLMNMIVILSLVLPGVFSFISTSVDADAYGPDYYGYYWVDELPYFWEEINQTGTLIKPGDWISGMDNGYHQAGIGFNINFYGSTYANINIGTNGMLSFSISGMTGSSSRNNRRIPDEDSPDRIIAPFWDDFEYVQGKSKVYYDTMGGAGSEYFVVEYENLINKYSGFPCTFEVILNETINTIWFLYKDLPRNQYCRGASATIGIEDTNGRGGLQYSYNEEVLREETAIRFIPNGISDTVTATTRSLAPKNIWVGNQSVPMLRLNITVGSNTAQLYSLRIYQTGSAGVDNISAVKIYMDANYNGIFERDLDFYGGSKTLVDAGIDYVYFYGLDIWFPTGLEICFFIVVDFEADAIPGETVQLSFLGAGDIDMQGNIDDPVSGLFPLQSAISTLSPNPRDHVTVNVDPRVRPKATISTGNNIVFMKLNFTIDSNITIVRELVVNQTGNATNFEANWISVYWDHNGNGKIDSEDFVIGSSSFDAFNSALIYFWGSGFKVKAGMPSYMLLEVQMNPTPNGKTVQLEIESFNKITLEVNDTVNNLNFPLRTIRTTVSNKDMIYINVESNPSSLASLRAGQRDAPILKINLTVSSGVVMIFMINLDKNNTGVFSDMDMPYQRLYEDVNDNGKVDEGIDILLCESSSITPTVWFWPMAMPWMITPNDPLVLLVTADIAELAPSGVADATGLNIPFANFISHNPWEYVLEDKFPIESNSYPIKASTADSLVVTSDSLMPTTLFAGDMAVVQRINVTTSANEVGLYSVTVKLNGSATSFDISWVEAYYDVNNDGRISPSIDIMLGTGWFDFENNATISLMSMGVPFVAKASVSKSILIVFTVSNDPWPGATAGLNIASHLNFTVEGPNDVVKPSGFPIDSDLAVIIFQDTLTCTKDSRISPTTVEECAREAPVMKINYSTSSGSIMVNNMLVGLVGTVSYLDLGTLYAYEDMNDNAIYDKDTDKLIGQSSFNMWGYSYIDLSMQGPFVVYSGINRSIMLLLDVHSSAYGKTIGFDIEWGNVSVDVPDNVSWANFPLRTLLISVIGAAHNQLIVIPKDIAPVNVTQAEETVEMLKLKLAADSGGVSITRVKIGFTGSAVYENISMAYLYWDINQNDIIDIFDVLLDYNTFFLGRLYFRIDGGFNVNASTEEHLIIAYDISLDAPIGKTVGVYIENEANITLDCSNDTVAVFSDYNSTASVIQPAIIDILTVSWSDVAPVETYEEDLNVEILRLTLTAESGDVYLTGLLVNLTGTATDGDINWISLIHDKNNNGKYDVGLDRKIGFGWFSDGTALVTASKPLMINASKPQTVIIAVDIGWNAGGTNFGLEIENYDYLYVKAPDSVNDLNFPIECSKINIRRAPNDNVTVQSTDLAPVQASPGDEAVPMMLLNFSVDAHTSYLQAFTVYMDGTAADSDVNELDLYLDVDSDRALDTGIDRWVGSGSFWSGSAWCNIIDNMRFTPTQPLYIFVSYQVRPGAVSGRLMGANISSSSDIVITWTDSVKSVGFPHKSSLTLINVPTVDNLTVAGNSQTPAEIDPGSDDVVMLQLNLTMDRNEGNVKTIKIQKLGSASDLDINAVYIYDDVNHNGLLEGGVDVLLGQGSFSNGNSTIQIFEPPSLGYKVNTSIAHLLVVYDISGIANLGETVGAGILDNTCIVIEGIDEVKNTNMPISSSLATIAVTATDYMNVSGGPITSGSVPPGANDIDMFYFELNVVTTGDARVTLIKVELDDSLDESYIDNVRLYEDANSNNQYDSGTDVLVGSSTTFSGNIAFWALSLVVSAGSPKTLLVVLDVSPLAPDAKLFNVSLRGASYITLDSPDNINSFSTIESNHISVIFPVSTVTVSGNSLMPVNVQQGSQNVLVEQISLTCDLNIAEITAIIIQKSGTLDDSFIDDVMLYDDKNDNSILDGADVQLGQGTFLGGTITFSGLSVVVSSSQPENLLILMNISSTARVGRTIGITLNSNLTLSVVGTDVISTSNFPITSATGTISDKPDTLTLSGSDKVPPEIMASSKEVLLAMLNFETSEDSVEITNLIFDVVGTVSYGNISEFKLYRDDNENGMYDPVGDTLLDNQGYSSTIKFECNQIINYGTPIQMLILVDVEPLATDGATFGIALDSASNVTISGSDLVSDTNLPFKTSLTTLRQHTDILTIDWKDRAPSSLEANSINITILDLMLNTDNNSIMVENINCGIIGSASLSSLSKASLYRDEDDNGEYSEGVDTLLDSVTITSSEIKFSISELVEKDAQLRLVITVDTASSVDIGSSFGFSLNTDSNLTVASPDKISNNNFPIVSSLVEFTGDITKPEVDSITMSKESPFGEGTLTFTIGFNEDMDDEVDPLVRFGTSVPYTTHTLTAVGWQDIDTWRGTFEIDSKTGDGQNKLSISGAMDIAGNLIDLDTSNSWIIDTTAPTVVAGSDITINAGETTDFNATNSFDTYGIQSYKWEFQYDDKLQALEGAVPKFTFDIPGDYKVTLTVTDVVGNAANDSIWVHVIETVVELPVIVSTTPDHNEEKVFVDISVIIRFSIPMSKNSVSGLLSIAPLELYDLYWGDNNRILRIKFRDDLDYNTTYTITLGTAEAEIGSTLENTPFELVFKTKNEPIIPAKNSKPKLSEGTITPESGDTETEYTFSVNYYDPDGDEPSEIQVVIDGVAYDMEPKFGENPTNGVYEFITTLDKGEHSYYFTASDGYTDAISGDGVTPAKLEDSQLTPAVDKVKRSQDDAGTMIWVALGIVIAIVAILLFFLLIKKRKKESKTDLDNDEGDAESEKDKKKTEPVSKTELNKTIKPRDTSFQIPASTTTTTKQIPKRLPKRLPKKI